MQSAPPSSTPSSNQTNPSQNIIAATDVIPEKPTVEPQTIPNANNNQNHTRKHVETIEEQPKPMNVSVSPSDKASLFNLTSENVAMESIEQDDNLTITTNLQRPLSTNVNSTQTTLILAPSGNAVAGNGGRASSETYSSAILSSNSNTSVRLLYMPESVAVAGAGGVAHAQSELDIWIM